MDSSDSAAAMKDGLAELESLIHQQLDTAEDRLLYSNDRPSGSSAIYAAVVAGARETEDTLHRIMLRMRRRVNLLAPVNRLPQEILCRLFSEGPSNSSQQSVRISHVCSYWRELALDDPRLWTSITIINGRTLPALAVLLSRAKQQPVDLRLYLVDIKGKEEQAGAALTCIVQHMQHMGKLSIHFNADLRKSLFRKLCDVHAPVLTSLSLSCTVFSSRYPLPVNIFNGNAPKLTELELSHISPANGIGRAFAGVRVIEMWQSCVTVDSLRRIAAACPAVEDITLQGWEGYASRTSETPGRLLSFEHLEQIAFIDMDPETVRAIISHLDCSNIDCIKVKCGPTSRHVPHLNLLRQLLGTLEPVTEALVEGHPIRASTTDSEPTRRSWRILAFDRNDVARELMFEDGLTPLARNALNPDGNLLLHVRKLTVDARCWAPFIDTVDADTPALGVLKLHIPEDTTDAALWHLNAVLKPVTSAKQPLRCPGLRRLVLKARRRVEVSAESVLQVLDQAIQIQAPKLKELRLKNITVKAGMGLEILRARVDDLSMV
ncbi:hypothetical protein EXIGLDRAFT_828924 [Exidia glandulosa HHB12029]|uniref:F-box domain-containing protein n=1 Tax=Exidia glandulosa HHB12029 TaxID=1314781 RepID=A0A165PX75_EXIGL|nr:hypothetical protein EXIGLDRAFT_828924 [Exidia glandulosa HHB12029]